MEIRTVEKDITIEKANRWIKAAMSKAIAKGEMETWVGGYEKSCGDFVTFTQVCYNFFPMVIRIWSDTIEVIYYGKDVTYWKYHLTK